MSNGGIKLLQHLLNILLRINLRNAVAFHADDGFHVAEAHAGAVQDKIAGAVAPEGCDDFPGRGFG